MLNAPKGKKQKKENIEYYEDKDAVSQSISGEEAAIVLNMRRKNVADDDDFL